jgi:4-amino-4-deoxy-L-arabinose transferase-like glycosyltransferase
MSEIERKRRRLEIVGLAAVLLIAALLRLWRLEANGFGTEYYAAGVRSMMQSGWLFFYSAFDPAGFVSLDKPPVAFWIQTAFAHLLGYSGLALHLPQALAGIASVAMLHFLARRAFGVAAGLIAALLLAVAPVAVAIDRTNNTDSWLVFFLLVAAGLALRGRGLSFVASMAVLGVAFNVKMLAALVCGPALLAAWLAASPLAWRSRLGWMMAGAATVAIVGLSWPIAFDLTPRDQRPYAGSTTGNSMLELVVVHNGLERFVRTRPQPVVPRQSNAPRFEAYDSVPAGPLRLAHPTLATQFAWLLPLALIGALLPWRRAEAAASRVLWGVWALAYGVVFSAAGGIFHLYYLAALAPPLAALAAAGSVQLWRRGPVQLAAGLTLAAAWQAWLLGDGPLGWQSPWMAAPAVALLAGLAALLRAKRPPALAGALALLVLPTAWALSPIFSPGNLTLPSASLPRWLDIADGRGPLLSRNYRPLSDDPKLADFLLAHRGDARFIAATPTALVAEPLIARTGLPVMAAGGFFGRDRILTVEAFADRVRRGEVRYMLVGTLGAAGPFSQWALEHGTLVDDSEWRSRPRETTQSMVLVDLKGS